MRGSSSSSSGSKKLEECSSSTRVYKKRAKNGNIRVDIISNLPEHILHHIFSFVDMKQTIQTTCLLSRRWRYFWVSLPTLKFTYTKGNRKTFRKEFMDFVDRVLMFRNNYSSSIDEFTLVSMDNIDLTDRLNTWIIACVLGNVQQLTLHTHYPNKFHFHHSFFTCKSLTKLVVIANLKRLSFSLPDSITLPRLKTLSLYSVKFVDDEDSTNQLFSSCPILESLTLNGCEFPRINVKISSPLLQHLILSNCITTSNALGLGPVETNFQLCAPNLISFYWSNDMSKHCAPKNLSSLVKANIHTNVYEDSKLSKEKKAMHTPFMVNLLRGLHNVEDLTLSAAFLEVVTGAPYLLDSQPTKFCNLRCLKLENEWRSVDCIHAISYLLKISPNIETLFAEVNYGAPDLLEVQPTQCCNLRCLKLEGFLSRDCIYAIAYFLKISPKIENLSFTLYVSYPSDKMYSYWNPDEATSNSAKRGDYWKAGMSLEGLLNHVKCFELQYVTGRINELELIEILLKNAMLLEELLIFFNNPYLCAKEKKLEERRLAKFSEKEKLLIVFKTIYSYSTDEETERSRFKFSEKVLTFPRSSSSAVIMFKYMDTSSQSSFIQCQSLASEDPCSKAGIEFYAYIDKQVLQCHVNSQHYGSRVWNLNPKHSVDNVDQDKIKPRMELQIASDEDDLFLKALVFLSSQIPQQIAAGSMLQMNFAIGDHKLEPFQL